MDEIVKASPGRSEQARTRLARAAVVEAARDLFLTVGYAAATVDAVSAASGVPPATVYRLFGSKIGILRAVLDVAAGGDDELVAFGDRPEIRKALALQDAHELLTFFARRTPAFMARVAPIYQMLTGAAVTDQDAAALLAEHIRQRQRGQARIASALSRLGALRPGVTERAAADIIYGLMSPDLYRLLVQERRWSSDRYGSWLAATLTQQLLRSPRPTASAHAADRAH